MNVPGWGIGMVLAVLLMLGSGCAARSTTGAYLGEPPPAGADRAARCESYAARLEISRAQLRKRNTFGRLDLLRAEHRRMERFVDAHCD